MRFCVVLFLILVALPDRDAVAGDYLHEANLTPSQAKRMASIIDAIRPLNPEDYRKLLFARCDPMFLRVGIHGKKEASAIGLTKTGLVELAEGRLRAARLFVERSYQSLDVNVNFGGSSLSIRVSLMRRVDDIGAGMDGVVQIWGTGSFGGYSTADTVHAAISRHVDEFITKYLRANDGICDMRWRQAGK